MDIYITEKETGAQIALSMMPEKTSRKTGTKLIGMDIINVGEVKIPKGTKLTTFSWKGTFPGASRKNMSFVKRQHWRDPKELAEIINSWRVGGTRLILMVTETSINNEVIVSDFDTDDEGGFGDISYSISFTEAKDVQIYTTSELNIKPAAVVNTAASAARPEPAAAAAKTHTVVSGDTLWGIAQKYYSAGNRYPEIYNANKDAIEAEAKKRGKSSSSNGHWIYPGMVLTIP